MLTNTSRSIKFFRRHSDHKSNAILFLYKLAEYGLSSKMNVARDVFPCNMSPEVGTQYSTIF